MGRAPRVKICGLTRRADAVLAAAAGAEFGGVILAPGGRRSVTPEEAARLLDGLALRRVGVFVDAGLAEIAAASAVAGLHVVQLHGAESPAEAARLRGEGQWAVWKAVRPRDAREFLDAVERFAGSVDGLLLDGWSAAAPGGTGASFPWEEVAAHRGRLPAGVELIVAGGLTPANVGRAAALLAPDVVDVSSGVELSPGAKDPAAVRAFVEAARTASPVSRP